MKTEPTLTEWTKGFYCGFMAAICINIRNYGMSTEVREMWQCCTMSIKKMKNAGVDEYDIKLLKQHWKELNPTKMGKATI